MFSRRTVNRAYCITDHLKSFLFLDIWKDLYLEKLIFLVLLFFENIPTQQNQHTFAQGFFTRFFTRFWSQKYLTVLLEILSLFTFQLQCKFKKSSSLWNIANEWLFAAQNSYKCLWYSYGIHMAFGKKLLINTLRQKLPQHNSLHQLAHKMH